MNNANYILKLLKVALPKFDIAIKKLPKYMWVLEKLPKYQVDPKKKYGLASIKGFAHKRRTAEINGVKGFLVWDFIVYNEIYFEDMNGNIFSFFTSMSDKKTRNEWDELIKKYGK